MNNKLTQSQETNISRSQRLILNARFSGIRAPAHTSKRTVNNHSTLSGISQKGLLE